MPVDFVPNQHATEAVTAHVLWITCGLSCEGDSVAMTAATNPSIEDIVRGIIPGMPRVVVHNGVVAYENGADFIEAWFQADRGELDPFVLVFEGSVPNEEINGDGFWTGFGVDPSTGQPITTNEWIDRLAPKAAAVVAVGTCATYGGIPAMKNNPTGAMGVPDYLGWNWKSKAGIPIVCIPGCPAQPDNMTETLLYLVLQLGGMAPMIPLDDALRPKWLFERTVRENCNRGGFSEMGNFATEYGDDYRCLVKLGCKGPVVKCNVPLRGWVNGVGGCPNVGGICMACTMPGFPDKYMPFMDEDTWGGMAANLEKYTIGPLIKWGRNRNIKNKYDKEPEWRKRGRTLDTGYSARHYANRERDDMATDVQAPQDRKVVVKEMSWDPITRIVGSLGIHTEIDFTNQEVLKCYSTSMVFRGFDIFMKGIDPRDAHFITSRICGICGDNHCTCSCLNQNMAYGVKPPKLGDYAFNLAESADFMFDHAIFNDCMANVDFCEQMVKETNPSVLAKAEQTAAPHSDVHGCKTIADIMRSLNPFTGDFYLETLHVARYTREMYCLFGGRHTHPSTIMPGGCSAHITHQTITDYYVRLMEYFDYCKRSIPLHDDLYDFFYEALPGYEQVGFRETDLVCWGCFDDPDVVDYDYRTMTEWGRARMVTPGIAIGGELVTTDLVEINGMIRILLGSSYFEDWEGEQTYVTEDPLGNPIDKHHPWNKTTIPKPQKRDFADKYSWVVSPRIYDKRTDRYVACDTGGGPFARQWVTAKAGLVKLGDYLEATGDSIKMTLPRSKSFGEMEFEWKVPQWSNAIERDRARAYHEAYSALVGFYNLQKAAEEVRAGRTKSWRDFKVPQDAVSVGFHEAARGVLSHHMVIRDGKIANYQPYPPTPWNASSRDTYGTPGPYEDSVQNTPIFEENGPDTFKGIDIMRAVRSFDPCLPCGVHMYLGGGQVKKVVHTPTGLC